MFADVIFIIFNKLSGFIKYGLVGSVGFAIHIFVLWFLTDIMHLWDMYSVVIAIVVAALNNYILNYHWTFKNKKGNVGNRVVGYFKYLLSRAFTEGLYLILYYIAVHKMGYYYLTSAIMIQVVTAVLGYIIALKWIWKPQKEDKCSL
ncbi:hypothetical protein LCGC14_1453950 [marine sediment metagenome]|uniref:GtrA/DPMS transmembrane domain-containing protein n=1 Tax=marine sediment metagenome TaxID=412755 RepID=A0A0F9K392_9ZZZZ